MMRHKERRDLGYTTKDLRMTYLLIYLPVTRSFAPYKFLSTLDQTEVPSESDYFIYSEHRFLVIEINHLSYIVFPHCSMILLGSLPLKFLLRSKIDLEFLVRHKTCYL